jgi:predicted amidohydrolase YtcJ
MKTLAVISASTVITMNPDQPRVKAVAVDLSTGRITALGTVAECLTAAPNATHTELGDAVLMPGFIDPHSHPMLSGLVTQAPSYWIAPYVGYPTFADVENFWHEVNAKLPVAQPVFFSGLDRLLQEAPELTNTQLDTYFPHRPAAVLDNSGHEAYFNSAAVTFNGWNDAKPPADPVGARYGRNDDGTSNGRAYETAAVMGAIMKVLTAANPHPLASGARWLNLMSSNGITATSEHTYASDMAAGYTALESTTHAPVRVGLYHMSIEPDCGETFTSTASTERLWKQGIKLWADGSPWVGTIAASFAYLDNDRVRQAQIPLGPGGEGMMNYTRAELDEILDTHTSQGWQFAFHVNGDIGLDIVLDSYERALATHGLLGTDHRWRIEHCGAARADQFDRAAKLGIAISLSPFQFIYWGDVLDGTLFPPNIGAQWMRAGDAFRSGAVVSFHNDGMVSPPIPLLNVQAMVTRVTPSGQLHGPEQQVSLDDALRAHTVNAAFTLGRNQDLGSLEVGKLADLVQLSADPYAVDVAELTTKVKVQGTWLGGVPTDAQTYLDEVKAIDPTEHPQVHAAAMAGKKGCC